MVYKYQRKPIGNNRNFEQFRTNLKTYLFRSAFTYIYLHIYFTYIIYHIYMYLIEFYVPKNLCL